MTETAVQFATLTATHITKKVRRSLKPHHTQSCVVVIGIAIEALAQTCAESENTNLHVYQISHDPHAGTPAFIREGHTITATVNLSDLSAVQALFQAIITAGHQPELVIFQPLMPLMTKTQEIQPTEIETRWQVTGLAAFTVAQTALQIMQENKHGTLIFLGSAHANLPTAEWTVDGALQAGIRALSQSLAREFHPKGIHIAYLALAEWHVEDQAVAQLIAQTCIQIHTQPKSTWVQELGVA